MSSIERWFITKIAPAAARVRARVARARADVGAARRHRRGRRCGAGRGRSAASTCRSRPGALPPALEGAVGLEAGEQAEGQTDEAGAAARRGGDQSSGGPSRAHFTRVPGGHARSTTVAERAAVARAGGEDHPVRDEVLARRRTARGCRRRSPAGRRALRGGTRARGRRRCGAGRRSSPDVDAEVEELVLPRDARRLDDQRRRGDRACAKASKGISCPGIGARRSARRPTASRGGADAGVSGAVCRVRATGGTLGHRAPVFAERSRVRAPLRSL